MHSISWPTLLASALVAILTTLAVEYFAKPGLEARKDRIVEKGQEKRNAIKQIIRLYHLLTDLRISYGKSEVFRGRPEWDDVMRERVRKMSIEIGELEGSLFQTIRMPSQVHDEWIHTTAIIYGFSRLFLVIQDLPENRWQEIEAATESLANYGDLLTTSKWDVWRRRKLIEQIKSSPLYTEALNDRNRYKASEENASVSSSQQDETA
jgi:hypothetical protein